MNSMKTIWKTVALALLAGPLALWLATSAYAQGFSTVSGTVLDTNAQPYSNVVLVFTNVDTSKTFQVKTDSKGRYSTPPIPGGTYNVDLKHENQTIYQTGLRISGGTTPTFDINMKEVMAKNKGAAEAEKKREEEQKAFLAMKSHYDAGMKAINDMKAAQAKLPDTAKDQQGPIQDQIKQAGATAITELTQAQSAMKPDDVNNQSIVSARLGEAYEAMGQFQKAADSYQKAITLKPDLAANYNNLGNVLAKLGKIDDARAAYQKYVDLNPTDAALAWRNFGIVLYQANRMKEAIPPLEKATTLDPNNAQAWLLLGIAKVNTMQFKTEGDKMTPIIEPGTIEAYQKAIQLDPKGPIGEQARQGLASLQAMGVSGINTKVGSVPPEKKKKKK